MRSEELAAALADEAAARGMDGELFRDLVAAIRDVIEQEANAFSSELESAYAPFNPDRDTLTTPEITAARTVVGYYRLHRQFAYLLNKANFARLSEVELDEAVRIACSRGMRVRLCPERIEELSVWVRGRDQIIRRRRTLRHPIRGVPFSVPVFRRMVVVCRLRDDPHVLLKMFKEIPEDDVEALLPHADVEMNWWDRVTLIGGSGGTLWTTATKLLGGGLAALGNLLWVLLAGLIMITWRAFSGYRNAHKHRNWQRTQQLYFQNVANNVGALFALVSMAAQEEFKEALLLFGALQWDLQAPSSASGPQSEATPHAGPAASSTGADPRAASLQAECNDWVKRRYGAAVEFDIHDALATLERLGLMADSQELCAADPRAALVRLREHWIARRSAGFHGQRALATEESEFVEISREAFVHEVAP